MTEPTKRKSSKRPAKRKRLPRDPLARAYVVRDGISAREANKIARAVRGVLT